MIKGFPKECPRNEGWIRGVYTLYKAEPMNADEIKKLVSFGKPELYEWGPVEQHGKKLLVFSRQINRVGSNPENP